MIFHVNIAYCSQCLLHSYQYTVEPLLSGPLLSGHPLLGGHLLTSRNLTLTFTVNLTSIKRSPLLSGRGHPFDFPNCAFSLLFAFIKRSPPVIRIKISREREKYYELSMMLSQVSDLLPK